MADKTIAQLAGLTGDDVAPDDLLPVWDSSGSVTKNVSVADLKRAVDLATETSALTLASLDGTDDTAEFTFNAKPLLSIGSLYALNSQMQGTATANTALSDNAVALYNPKGNIYIQTARSDTSATSTAGFLNLMGGVAAAGSNLAGGGAAIWGGSGDGGGKGGAATLRGGAAGSVGTGGEARVIGGLGGATSGSGGSVTVQGGVPTDGNGGSVAILGCNAAGTNRDGGSVTVTAGTATGTGTPGAVMATAGTAGLSLSPTAGARIGQGDTTLSLTDGGTNSGLATAAFDSGALLKVGSLTSVNHTNSPAVSSAPSALHQVVMHSFRGSMRISAAMGSDNVAAPGQGASVFLSGGNAQPGQNKLGGDVSLNGGSGDGTAAGGNVTLAGGEATGSGSGGSVTIAAGNATGLGMPGNVSILAGGSTSTFGPTRVSIGARDSGLALADTGDESVADLTLDGKNLLRIGSNFTMWPQMTGVSVTNEVGSQNGVGLYNPRGVLRINAGNSATTANGKAAALQLCAGFAAAGSGLRGGGLILSGGPGDGPGDGGPVFLSAGSAGATGNGGDATIQGGDATGGNGGSVFLTGRNAGGTDHNGGSVTIASGTATGTGIPGAIVLNPAVGGHVALNGTLRFADGSKMASAVATRHVATFNADSDWSAASGGYHTLTVPAAVHGRGTTPLVQLHELNGGDHDLVQGDRLQVRANGDVVLHTPDTPDGRFAGRLIIL